METAKKPMTLEAEDFIRRFLLDVLPDGFMKIRYFGFLSHRNKNRCTLSPEKALPNHELIPDSDK
jgi:hypothetical protein